MDREPSGELGPERQKEIHGLYDSPGRTSGKQDNGALLPNPLVFAIRGTLVEDWVRTEFRDINQWMFYDRDVPEAVRKEQYCVSTMVEGDLTIRSLSEQERVAENVVAVVVAYGGTLEALWEPLELRRVWVPSAGADVGESDLTLFRHELDTIAQQVFDEVASENREQGSQAMADTPRTDQDGLREEFRNAISDIRIEFRRDLKDLRGELVTAINTSQQLVLRDIDRIATEVATLRSETRDDRDRVAAELTALHGEFRAELDRVASETTALRTETRSDLNAFRTESRTDLEAFRTEVRDALMQLQQESRNHTVQIAEIKTSIRTTTTVLGVLITIVGVIAGVLGAIAAF